MRVRGSGRGSSGGSGAGKNAWGGATERNRPELCLEEEGHRKQGAMATAPRAHASTLRPSPEPRIASGAIQRNGSPSPTLLVAFMLALFVPKLESLELSLNQLGDEGLATLASSAGRMLGPPLWGFLYVQNVRWPYEAASISCLASSVVFFAVLTIHNKKKTETVRSTIATIKEWEHGPTGTSKALYEKIRYHDKKKFGVDPCIRTYDDLQKLPTGRRRQATTSVASLRSRSYLLPTKFCCYICFFVICFCLVLLFWSTTPKLIASHADKMSLWMLYFWEGCTLSMICSVKGI